MVARDWNYAQHDIRDRQAIAETSLEDLHARTEGNTPPNYALLVQTMLTDLMHYADLLDGTSFAELLADATKAYQANKYVAASEAERLLIAQETSGDIEDEVNLETADEEVNA